MDILEELNGSQEPNGEAVSTEPQAEAPVAEAPAEEAQPEVEDKPDRPRGPDGKFAKKEEPVMVPLQALHETRDEVKTLKAELDKLRQPQQPQQVPDIFENPEGFAGHIQTQIAQATINTTLNISEEMARASAGNEVVDAAQQWGAEAFKANPALAQQFFSQRNPYGFLVQQYQRATLMQQLGDDPAQIEQFIKWREAQSAPQPTPQAIPTSLADQQSSRGSAVPYQPPSLEDLLKG